MQKRGKTAKKKEDKKCDKTTKGEQKEGPKGDKKGP